ncbi:hypothetical protein Bpfe_019436, partial [Biomphalaria pfeifferi]
MMEDRRWVIGDISARCPGDGFRVDGVYMCDQIEFGEAPGFRTRLADERMGLGRMSQLCG